jgi:NAD(P)-dependent dehydrogenase (short-subunit alcohol dehydrogenase family)
MADTLQHDPETWEPIFERDHEDQSLCLCDTRATSSSAPCRPHHRGLDRHRPRGAIATLLKHIAAALGPRGIRVNAVTPGVIDADMSSFAKTEDGRVAVMGMQALKRIGQPADVASVAFLVSGERAGLRGDTIHVDGGSKL